MSMFTKYYKCKKNITFSNYVLIVEWITTWFCDKISKKKKNNREEIIANLYTFWSDRRGKH